MNVVVIGASNNPDRYSYKAIKLLQEKGHVVFAVNPRLLKMDDLAVYPSIVKIDQSVHTISLYVSADISSRIADDLLEKRPQRIIFNPGAENESLFQRASLEKIETLNACTLVLLKTGQF